MKITAYAHDEVGNRIKSPPLWSIDVELSEREQLLLLLNGALADTDADAEDLTTFAQAVIQHLDEQVPR